MYLLLQMPKYSFEPCIGDPDQETWDLTAFIFLPGLVSAGLFDKI